MFRLTPTNSGNRKDQLTPKSTQMFDSTMMKPSNMRSWVYNTDLKYAIGDLRNQLMNEAKNTNPAMKQQIHDWVTRDYEEAATHMTAKDTPVAKENEAMRQLISDLLNGPIASLLNTDGRNKLCRLSIPSLPANGGVFFDDANYDDLYSFESGPSFYSGSLTSSIRSSGISDLNE